MRDRLLGQVRRLRRLVQDLADARRGQGRRRGRRAAAKEIEDLKISKKENIEVGKVVRFEAADGNILDSYLHLQDGRGVNAVLVELAGRRQGAGPRPRACTSPSPSRRT